MWLVGGLHVARVVTTPDGIEHKLISIHVAEASVRTLAAWHVSTDASRQLYAAVQPPGRLCA